MLGQDLDEREIEERLQTDTSDNGYAHLSDAEIVAEVTSSHQQDSGDETEAEAEQGADSSPLVPHGHAVKMFDSCIAWLQQQDEASAYNMSVLHNLRELAAGKRLTSIKQKKLTDYLSV